MMDPTRFDAFYADTRQRLLHQTYALTGDQRAAQLAVRDAFISAWHHWAKVSRQEDPERWVRPLAWSHALRRHGARIWHRDKAADAEQSATVQALGELTVPQRRVLLLSHLTTGSMEDIAREAGLPIDEAERTLQAATAAFATARSIDSTAIRPLLEDLAGPVADVRLPRMTIIRRAGTARRRTYTVVGVAGALVALVASGVAVNAEDGVLPDLTHQPPSPTAGKTSTSPQPTPDVLSEDDLLTADQVTRVAPELTWQVKETSENIQGKGLVLPCQTSRFADPRSAGYLVRTFSAAATGKAKDAVAAAAIQTTELSTTTKRAKAAFATTRDWFAGCTDGRTHLQETGSIDGVGDQATLFVLNSWDGNPASLVVGVARTGQVTTTTVARSSATPDLKAGMTLLAAAVNALCGAPGTAACAGPPTMEAIPPLAAGPVPGMLSEVDLPQLSNVEDRWAGTEPKQAQSNPAATQCDNASFTKPPMGVAITRTFLLPRADLPTTFGLTETVGSLPAKQASAFVEDVRRRLAVCPDKTPGTEVTRLTQRSAPDADLSVWRLKVAITDKQEVTYLMGITRSGTAIGQVSFIAAPGVTMSPDDFIALVERAQERLPRLPEPGSR
jgi:DNA-directed RNA polymerase specialized sigma24 family protein